MSRVASLPGAELLLRNRTFFEQATCPRQLRCLGQISFLEIGRFFLNKPLVPGSFAAWGRFVLSRVRLLFEQVTCPGQLRCLGQNFFSKSGLSGILGLLRAEQDVGNLKKMTFRSSGTPVRRTKRQKSKKVHLQELWDSCAQNKASEI